MKDRKIHTQRIREKKSIQYSPNGACTKEQQEHVIHNPGFYFLACHICCQNEEENKKKGDEKILDALEQPKRRRHDESIDKKKCFLLRFVSSFVSSSFGWSEKERKTERIHFEDLIFINLETGSHLPDFVCYVMCSIWITRKLN